MAAETAGKAARSVDSGLIPGAFAADPCVDEASGGACASRWHREPTLISCVTLSVCVHARAGMLLRGFRARGTEGGSVFVMQ